MADDTPPRAGDRVALTGGRRGFVTSIAPDGIATVTVEVPATTTTILTSIDALAPADAVELHPASATSGVVAEQGKRIRDLSGLLRGMACRASRSRKEMRQWLALAIRSDGRLFAIREACEIPEEAPPGELLAEVKRLVENDDHCTEKHGLAAPETSDPTPAEVASRLSAAAEVCEKHRHHGLAFEFSEIASQLDEDGYSAEVCAAVARALSGPVPTTEAQEGHSDA